MVVSRACDHGATLSIKALVATAIGLLVAIPAVIAYNAYQKQVKAIMAGLEGVKDLCLAYAKSHNLKKGDA